MFQSEVNELPQEENAGLGLGIALVVAASVIAALFHWRQRSAVSSATVRKSGLTIGWGAWVAMVIYMMKVGAPATGRLLAAYYPMLLLPVLLHAAQSKVVRQFWWQMLALATSISGLIVVVLTPSRPLWPAETVLATLCEKFPRNEQLDRARVSYSVYRNRNDLFAPLRGELPASATVVGLIEGNDDPETSLWHPFGSRRFEHIVGNARSQRPGIEWVIIKNDQVGDGPDAFESWLKRTGGTLVTQKEITELVSVGPTKWSIVQFQ